MKYKTVIYDDNGMIEDIKYYSSKGWAVVHLWENPFANLTGKTSVIVTYVYNQKKL
jgi:hypothetical protein